MNPVFLDSSGLIGAVNSRDQWHDAAASAWMKLIGDGAPLLTSSLVLVEVADAFSKVGHRPRAIEIFDRLTIASEVEVVFVSEELFDAGWQLFRSRPDKAWSLTDCVSITLAQRRFIRQFFACDSHFEQAGFENLIKS